MTLPAEPSTEPSTAAAGFLLEIASAMTGMGVRIHEGIIQGDPTMSMAMWDKHSAIASEKHDLSKGRLFKFW